MSLRDSPVQPKRLADLSKFYSATQNLNNGENPETLPSKNREPWVPSRLRNLPPPMPPKKTWELVLSTITESRIVLTATAIILFMGLFPPWHVKITVGERDILINLGYNFIFSPPKLNKIYGGSITVTTLMVQILITVTVAAGFVYVKKTNSCNTTSSSTQLDTKNAVQ
jgi:hypothetical protein